MLNHARRRAFVVPFVASVCLFWVSDTWAQSADDLPHPRRAMAGRARQIGMPDLMMLRSRVTKDP